MGRGRDGGRGVGKDGEGWGGGEGGGEGGGGGGRGENATNTTNTAVVMFVYDVTSEDSFLSLESWWREYLTYDPTTVLCGV